MVFNLGAAHGARNSCSGGIPGGGVCTAHGGTRLRVRCKARAQSCHIAWPVRIEHLAPLIPGLRRAFDAPLVAPLDESNASSPRSYAEEPSKPEWACDPMLDGYARELLHEFTEVCKPALGIFQGAPLINLATGGTLY